MSLRALFPYTGAYCEHNVISSSSWNCGVSTLITNPQKPTGIADVYSKFRPVKRVSPLKHQPETLENNENDDQKNSTVEYQKGGETDQGSQPEELNPEDGVRGLPGKGSEPSQALGELEHYDLDMDEILDVPYIKSSQQLAPLTKVTSEKRILGLCTTINGLSGKACPIGSTENSTVNMTPFCVLSPVKSPHLRKASTTLRDQNKLSTEDSENSPVLGKCVPAYESENHSKDFLNKAFSDPHSRKIEKTGPDCKLRAFHLPSSAAGAKAEEQVNGMNWTNAQGTEERNEYLKKVRSIVNIVKEGQISLLPHLAADNLDKIHDENGNNLLHVAASKGHAECLQHLTSLMGEDCLNERNTEQLTPAGLAIKPISVSLKVVGFQEKGSVVDLLESVECSSPSSPASRKSQWKILDADDEATGKSKPGAQEGIQVLGSLSASSRARTKGKDEDSDKILRQLLGKEISENVCNQEKLSLEFQDAQASSRNSKKIPLEKRELKLARLRQLMQRSLSESDTDSNNSEDPKNTPVRRADRPRPQPIVESVENMDSTESLHLMIKKHSLASGRRFPFSTKASKSLDGHSPSPTSESSEPDLDSHCPGLGMTSPTQPSADPSQSSPDSSTAQKVATSPKSALKSPSSKRRTSQNSKLRVTFEEPVVQVEQTSLELNGEKDKDRVRAPQRTSESGEQMKRPFGTFRSIMETLSGNQNNNNNYQPANQLKTCTLPLTSLGRKTADTKGNPVSPGSKGKNKAVSAIWRLFI
ncbi:synuclein alpha interacting protein (synphilin) [Cricetulus griseus]